MAVTQNITLVRTASYPQANYSVVEFAWKSNQTGESHNNYTRTAKYYVSINGGAETEYTVTYTLPVASTVLIAYATLTIPHKADGTATVTVRTWMDTDISAGVIALTRSLNLPAFPRATTLDSLVCSTAYFDGTITFKYTPKSSDYYNCYDISAGDVFLRTIYLGKKATSQQTETITFSTEDLSAIYTSLPNTKTGKLRITFGTYYNVGYTERVGDQVYSELTLSIPQTSATIPTVTFTVTPDTALPSPFDKLYIKGKSRFIAVLSDGVAKFGATILSYNIYLDNGNKAHSYSSEDFVYTSEYLNTVGSLTITGSATDSRGLGSGAIRKTITVIDYNAPQITPVDGESEVVASRCDSSGNLSENGTFLKIKAKRNYSKVLTDGVQKNFCSIRFRYKAEGGTYSAWTTILESSSSSDEVITAALLYKGTDGDGKSYGALDVARSYLVQVQAIDDVGETGTTTITLPSERVYMHKAGSINSFGFGEYVEEENTVSIAEDIGVRLKGGFKAVEIPDYTDLNTLTKPNNYFGIYAGYINCPIEESPFSLEVICMGEGQLLQRLTRCSEESTVYERLYYSNVWHDWDCVNPPMVLGTEYRTKERYLGKPVYTKLVDIGALPNTKTSMIAHNIAAIDYVIRCGGQMSNGNSLPFQFDSTNCVKIHAGREYVVVQTGDNKTAITAVAQLWYTKQ